MKWCPECQSLQQTRKEIYISIKGKYYPVFCQRCNTLLQIDYPQKPKKLDYPIEEIVKEIIE